MSPHQYFNNDVLLGRPLSLEAFFDRGGAYKVYQDWRIRRNPVLKQNRVTSSTEDRACYDDISATDLPLGIAPSLSWERKRPVPTVLRASPSDVCYKSEPFLYDFHISRWAWGQPLNHWYAHTPHLWQRSVCQYVEETLKPHFEQMRRNRFRNPKTDINMHLQYEGALRMEHQARFGTRTDLPVPLKERPSRGVRVTAFPVAEWFNKTRPQYIQEVFNTCDHKRMHEIWAELYCKTQLYEAQFIAIDDDLTLPSDECVQRNRFYFSEYLERFWPDAAPWEATTHHQASATPPALAAKTPPKARRVSQERLVRLLDGWEDGDTRSHDTTIVNSFRPQCQCSQEWRTVYSSTRADKGLFATDLEGRDDPVIVNTWPVCMARKWVFHQT